MNIILSIRIHRFHTKIKFIKKKNKNFIFDRTVVAQYYEADVNKEHVIRGNAAVIKCLIPSFVADFVTVESWHTDQDEAYYPGTDYGLFCYSFHWVIFLFFFFAGRLNFRIIHFNSCHLLRSNHNFIDEFG